MRDNAHRPLGIGYARVHCRRLSVPPVVIRKRPGWAHALEDGTAAGMFLVILTVGYSMTWGGYFVISDIEVRLPGHARKLTHKLRDVVLSLVHCVRRHCRRLTGSWYFTSAGCSLDFI